jgi:crossover junction endodeoxyribonuclease RusA
MLAEGPGVITFFCPGKPQSQGSKVKTRWGMREDNTELGPWRERVALAAHHALIEAGAYSEDVEGRGQGPLRGPICMMLSFVLYRPKSASKTKTPAATKAPDLDKLARGCLDAMTHVIYQDDAQVVSLLAQKRVAEPGEELGVNVTIWQKSEIDSDPQCFTRVILPEESDLEGC